MVLGRSLVTRKSLIARGMSLQLPRTRLLRGETYDLTTSSARRKIDRSGLTSPNANVYGNMKRLSLIA